MPAPEPRCSGAMTRAHDPSAPVALYRIPGRTVAMCQPCVDAASRLGMVDRRT